MFFSKCNYATCDTIQLINKIILYDQKIFNTISQQQIIYYFNILLLFNLMLKIYCVSIYYYI